MTTNSTPASSRTNTPLTDEQAISLRFAQLWLQHTRLQRAAIKLGGTARDVGKSGQQVAVLIAALHEMLGIAEEPALTLDPKDTIHLRLWDLVRCQRAELHQQDLITDAEYEELIKDDCSVDRLHSYDEVTARARSLETRLAEATEVLRQCAECLATCTDDGGTPNSGYADGMSFDSDLVEAALVKARQFLSRSPESKQI